jgi:transposase InsO family protein
MLRANGTSGSGTDQIGKPDRRGPLRCAIWIHDKKACSLTSRRYTERLAQAGIEPSVGSIGDSYDNVLAESIGLLKTEVIGKRGPWRHLQAVEFATLEWVDWFNHRRLLEPIGDIPPAKLEEVCYRQSEESAMAA